MVLGYHCLLIRFGKKEKTTKNADINRIVDPKAGESLADAT